jgi:hypothetical protein
MPHRLTCHRLLFCLLCVLAGVAGSPHAQVIQVPKAAVGTISLKWNPVPGASGYRIYYGTESGTYTDAVDVGAKAQGTVSGLTDCTTYYVAVKAYNAAGESTEFSNEIAGWPRPRVGSVDPPAFMQGTQVVVNLAGANFAPGATLEFDATSLEGEPLVTVGSLSATCESIQALVAVEPGAPGARAMEIGAHEFEVRNPDGVVGNQTYEVTINPARFDINRTDADTSDRVDGKDLVWLAYAHGTSEGQSRFNADADLTGNGSVDGEDLAYLAAAFGSCWSGSSWDASACP